jgi:hypothetical protein
MPRMTHEDVVRWLKSQQQQSGVPRQPRFKASKAGACTFLLNVGSPLRLSV